MTKKGFGVSALTEKLEEKSGAPTSHKHGVKTKTISSPIESPAMAKNQSRIQRMYIDLPVTKNRVECEYIEILPEQCVVSRLNKRVQSLLSPSDPAIIKLKNSIQEDAQRDPVLLRSINSTQGMGEYELIYGSRRRFVIELLRNEGIDVKLRAWVANSIPDSDAKKLADSENEDRQAISAWEIAKYYEAIQRKNNAVTAEYIATEENITASSVRRYLQLATLPEDIVKKVKSPTEISLRSGLDILKIINQQQPDRRKEIIDTVKKMDSFDSSNDLSKAIKDIATPKESKVKNSKPIDIVDNKGNHRAKIGTHRSKKGKYKIDLFDAKDEEIQKVIEALEIIFK
jgi:ParB/RepB/Spo0J family partition protein